MLGHFDERVIEQAAVLLKVAKRHSSDELDAALRAGHLAIEYSLKEINATGDASRALIEAIDVARSIVSNRG